MFHSVYYKYEHIYQHVKIKDLQNLKQLISIGIEYFNP